MQQHVVSVFVRVCVFEFESVLHMHIRCAFRDNQRYYRWRQAAYVDGGGGMLQST